MGRCVISLNNILPSRWSATLGDEPFASFADQVRGRCRQWAIHCHLEGNRREPNSARIVSMRRKWVVMRSSMWVVSGFGLRVRRSIRKVTELVCRRRNHDRLLLRGALFFDGDASSVWPCRRHGLHGAGWLSLLVAGLEGGGFHGPDKGCWGVQCCRFYPAGAS